MPRFVIERNIPNIESLKPEEYRDGAQKSNEVLFQMKGEKKNIQWEQSYVVDNKLFCVYQAENEALVQEHAQRSGFPAHKVSPVRTVLDPITAERY